MGRGNRKGSKPGSANQVNTDMTTEAVGSTTSEHTSELMLSTGSFEMVSKGTRDLLASAETPDVQRAQGKALMTMISAAFTQVGLSDLASGISSVLSDRESLTKGDAYESLLRRAGKVEVLVRKLLDVWEDASAVPQNSFWEELETARFEVSVLMMDDRIPPRIRERVGSLDTHLRPITKANLSSRRVAHPQDNRVVRTAEMVSVDMVSQGGVAFAPQPRGPEGSVAIRANRVLPDGRRVPVDPRHFVEGPMFLPPHGGV